MVCSESRPVRQHTIHKVRRGFQARPLYSCRDAEPIKCVSAGICQSCLLKDKARGSPIYSRRNAIAEA
jgi:hypothetical protein